MKTYDELIEELDYYIKNAKISNNDIEKLELLKKCIISNYNFLSIKNNKYLSNVIESFNKDIDSRINACKRNMQMILDKTSKYSLAIESKEIDDINRKIAEYESIKKNIPQYYINSLKEKFGLDSDLVNKLYSVCFKEISNMFKGHTTFFNRELSNNALASKDTINDIYVLICNNSICNKYSCIVNLRKMVIDIKRQIEIIKFTFKNKNKLQLYYQLEDSISKDTKFLINKSIQFDEVNKKLLSQKSHFIIKKLGLYSKTENRVNEINSIINKRYYKQLKKVACMHKIKNYFNEFGIDIDELKQYLYYDDNMFEELITSLSIKLSDTENELLVNINKLSNEENIYLNDNYYTIQNIVNYILNNQSNIINIYIMYILTNLDAIINDKLNTTIQDQYSVNDVIAKFKNICNSKIEEVSAEKRKVR